MNKILVTGSTGFIGQRLCAVLQERGLSVREAVRNTSTVARDAVAVGAIDEQTNWAPALKDVSVIIHLAGRAHVMHDDSADPLAAYRRVNVAGTSRLAQMAAAAGVRRLVFVSSIKVNGEATDEQPFTEMDTPAPRDPYGISKWEAEEELKAIGRETGLEIVVVRPSLVYGSGVKGNFLSLMRLVHKGIPLPVAGCDNRRSLLGLENFVDFLATCVDHPASPGQTFVLSDGEDLSTSELIRHLASAMGRPARLFSIPPAWLQLAANLFGKSGVYQRLCGSLRVDSSHARRVLGWVPPQTVDAGLVSAVRTFLQWSGE